MATMNDGSSTSEKDGNLKRASPTIPYDAVTFDTQAVQAAGFRFESGLLAQFAQFKRSPTKVVIAQVVANEVISHLADRSRAAKEAYERSQEKLVEVGLLSAAAAEQFQKVPEPIEHARQRVNAFISTIGADVAAVDFVSVRELTRMYFTASAPFSNVKKDKKHEFPDAIALLSIEAWAEKK